MAERWWSSTSPASSRSPVATFCFSAAARDKRPAPVLADIRSAGILTIGESDVSGADGVVINFRLDDGKVRFDINVDSAKREKRCVQFAAFSSLARIVVDNSK